VLSITRLKKWCQKEVCFLKAGRNDNDWAAYMEYGGAENLIIQRLLGLVIMAISLGGSLQGE
jgi:hypothetical protein